MRLTVALCLFAFVAQAGTWSVAPRPNGSLRFKVEGPLDDVVGEARVISGNLELDPNGWASGHGVVAVDLAQMRTGIDERDRDMRVEFLQTQRFPFALMTVDKIERPSAEKLEPGKDAQGEAVGSFEVHGIRRAVRVPVKLKLDDKGRLTIAGAFEVPFADYGIQRPQRLFLKLGDTADITFEVAFVQNAPKEEQAQAAQPQPAVKPPDAPTVANVQPASAKSKPRPPRKPKPQLTLVTLFKGDDDKAKGEKLFDSPELGGPGNKLTCGHCHAKTDERGGLKQGDGYARSGHPLYNSAQRPRFWNGFAPDVVKGSVICQKMFMRGDGFTADQAKLLGAFLEAISPDPAAELDYRIVYRTYDSAIRDPIGGDAVRGKALADVYCMTCHLDGRAAPTFAPGLYEPEWLVRRVRHLEGHADKQMPAFTIDRLPDTDLRDIVTFLTSPKVAPPIFNRKKAPEGGGKGAGEP
jgi:polyisoprenoid-binding protein YceI